jgi:plastocyanin
MRPVRLVVPLLALLAIGAAGCGSSKSSSSSGTGGAYSSTPATTQTSVTTASTPTPTATTPTGGRSAVVIAATEFKLTPAAVTAKAGKATFTLRNDGGAMHALEITGNGVEKSTAPIPGGSKATLTVDLKPGKYQMYCPVGNHRAMGMVGTLTVS